MHVLPKDETSAKNAKESLEEKKKSTSTEWNASLEKAIVKKKGKDWGEGKLRKEKKLGAEMGARKNSRRGLRFGKDHHPIRPERSGKAGRPGQRDLPELKNFAMKKRGLNNAAHIRGGTIGWVRRCRSARQVN